MRFMVIVKATKDSKPASCQAQNCSPRWHVQRGIGEGRRHAGWRGIAPELERLAGQIRRQESHGDGWAVRRDEGVGGWVLDLEMRFAPGGDRVAEALPESAQRGRRA